MVESAPAVRERSQIPTQYKWNAESVFPTVAAWEEEFGRARAALADLQRYQGRLAEGPQVAAQVLAARDDLFRRVWKILNYASISAAVDTADQAAAQLEGRAQGLVGEAMAIFSFIEPELLAIGQDKLRDWLKRDPQLAAYEHYFDDLFRKQEHVRSAEVEELLGMLNEPFAAIGTTATMLANADFKFPPARTVDGGELPVTQGTLDGILAGSDREARRTAWEGYMDTYLAYKNTLASNLTASVKANVFNSRARRFPSSLAAALFQSNIPRAVFDNLIATFRKNLPTWHRYWALRRRALGVEKLYPYDIWAPLTTHAPSIRYEDAVDMVCAGLMPMGENYVDVVRQGCLQDRWVDVYPNRGKTAGAFSAGSPGTLPFIVMSYDDTIYRLSTLAHELGHSMHSYLTWQNQPTIYTDYSIFVAEVASNFHQAMVRADLLANHSDPDFQISVISEAMDNFHRYFFIMPTLARFELEMHERIERGEGVSADTLIELMADLFEEGYGGEMVVDRPRVGMTWATFGHLYADYYVYQYATGISAAHALSRRILAGQSGAVDAYLSFLKAGNSMYPLDVLKMAGVDLTQPTAVEETFGVLSGMVDRLTRLLD